MKLPKLAATSRHPIRDAQILRLFMDGHSMEEIGQRFGISQQRVNVIIWRNRSLLVVDSIYEKAKRVARLQRIARSKTDRLAPAKDILNVLEQLRREIEGDKPVVDQSIHITNISLAETIKKARERVANRIGPGTTS